MQVKAIGKPDYIKKGYHIMIMTLLEFLQKLTPGQFHFHNRDENGTSFYPVDAALDGWDPSDPALSNPVLEGLTILFQAKPTLSHEAACRATSVDEDGERKDL
jgi:hypothetical protein